MGQKTAIKENNDRLINQSYCQKFGSGIDDKAWIIEYNNYENTRQRSCPVDTVIANRPINVREINPATTENACKIASINFPDAISSILFNSNWKEFLILRLVSKMFALASITNTDFFRSNDLCSPLAYQASMFVKETDPLAQEKLMLAKYNNMEVRMTISVDDFLNKPIVFQNIADEKLRVVLAVDNFVALEMLTSLLMQEPKPEKLNKIKRLDLQNLKPVYRMQEIQILKLKRLWNLFNIMNTEIKIEIES